jgi:hypothetical protein
MTAAAQTERKLTAHDLDQAIRARYESPEWHVESEVTLASRRLDLVAFNLWSARSYRVVGFEIKVSRGDWMREIAAFQKSEDWTAVVDAFYVVTPPKLVKDEELPIGWGLLEFTGGRMMTRRHATIREGATTLPREVAARFFTRLTHRASVDERQAEMRARDDLRREIRAEIEKQNGKAVETLADENVRLEREHRELLSAMGLRPSDWRAHEKAMKAAAAFASLDSSAVEMMLERSATKLEEHAVSIRSAIATLRGETA